MSNNMQEFLKSCNIHDKTNKQKKTYLEAFEEAGIDGTDDFSNYTDEEIKEECQFKPGHFKR